MKIKGKGERQNDQKFSISVSQIYLLCTSFSTPETHFGIFPYGDRSKSFYRGQKN